MAEFLLEHKYKPAQGNREKSPVIIMLHGYGSDENDLFSFAGELPEDYALVSARAPYTMQPFGNAWYAIHWDQVGANKFNDIPQAVKSRDLIASFIDQVIAAYPVDPNKVVLLGFSQGTILSLAVALSYPEKVRYVVGLSGYVAPDMYKEGYQKNNFNNLEVYSSHGTVDQVIPVAWAQKTPAFLTKLGIKNSYSEFPVGHGVAPQNFYEFKNWLEQRL